MSKNNLSSFDWERENHNVHSCTALVLYSKEIGVYCCGWEDYSLGWSSISQWGWRLNKVRWVPSPTSETEIGLVAVCSGPPAEIMDKFWHGCVDWELPWQCNCLCFLIMWLEYNRSYSISKPIVRSLLWYKWCHPDIRRCVYAHMAKSVKISLFVLSVGTLCTLSHYYYDNFAVISSYYLLSVNRVPTPFPTPMLWQSLSDSEIIFLKCLSILNRPFHAADLVCILCWSSLVLELCANQDCWDLVI